MVFFYSLDFLTFVSVFTIAAIEKHFEDFHEDQFDFHSYCIRKVTLRSYVNVLRFEDELWGHKIYQQAAGGLIRIYLHLSDHPEEAKGGDASDVDYSSLTAAQKKKARKKKKQEEAKRNVDNSKETATATKKKNSVDVDPKGEEYLNLDPLEQATKYSNSLVTHAPTSLQSWLLRYDVSIRRQKVPMALQVIICTILTFCFGLFHYLNLYFLTFPSIPRPCLKPRR